MKANPGKSLRECLKMAGKTYKKVKAQKQKGGMGCPMGGNVETMVDGASEVAGSADRAVTAGPEKEMKSMEDAHMMGGKKMRKSKKSLKSKKGGKSKKNGKNKKGGKSVKNRTRRSRK